MLGHGQRALARHRSRGHAVLEPHRDVRSDDQGANDHDGQNREDERDAASRGWISHGYEEQPTARLNPRTETERDRED